VPVSGPVPRHADLHVGALGDAVAQDARVDLLVPARGALLEVLGEDLELEALRALRAGVLGDQGVSRVRVDRGAHAKHEESCGEFSIHIPDLS